MDSAPNQLDGPERTAKFAIASTRVVTPAGEIAAAVVIENGIIVDVVDRNTLPESLALEDCGDRVISPGIVDAHVHINEPGRADWEGFATATAAAAAGGITTLIDMPLNSSPVTTTVAALEAKRAAASGKCHVEVGFYGGLVPGNESDLPELVDSGVFGIKAFLCDSGLDEFPASGESELRAALGILGSTGVPLLAHAELISTNPPTIEDVKSYQQYAASRPDDFELAAIGLLIDLCREYQTPVHIVHLATAAALPMIETAHAAGLPLTVETCPHYMFFSEQQIEDGETQFKCAPPIRDEANRVALCRAIANSKIETIGSDHSPCPPELKCLDTGDFTKAWGGIAGLQLSLPVTWTVGQEFGWTPSMLAQRMSTRPAEVFGLAERKGSIKVGCDADLVVWDPDESFSVVGEDLLHKHKVTPYDQREVSGKVSQTYVRGQLVYSNGQIKGQPIGQLLKRINRSNARAAKFLNELNEEQRATTLETCCASLTWVNRMMAANPPVDDDGLCAAAETAWEGLTEQDLLQAFSAHPRIGDINSLREKYANTKAIAGGEQAGVEAADEAVLQRLAEANDEYFNKFGFIFIVCATGKSAAEMLEILEKRLPNERSVELQNAAAEQLKITQIRLRKLVP